MVNLSSSNDLVDRIKVAQVENVELQKTTHFSRTDTKGR